MMTELDPSLAAASDAPRSPHAIVIGAGLGGLAAAMRLGAKGYRVTVIDRLDVPGGRGPAIVQRRPPIRPRTDDRDRAAALRRPLGGLRTRFPRGGRPAPRSIRSTRSAGRTGRTFTARQDTEAMKAEVARLSPSRPGGLPAIPRGQRETLLVRLRGSGPPLDAPVCATSLQVLPEFAMLRADRSVYAHAARG